MFERMEITEAIYVGGSPSKNKQREESERAIFGRKQKGGGSAQPSNLENGLAGKRKGNDAGHTSDALTGEKNTVMLHGPGHSSEQFKVLQEYSKNHIVQQPFKDKQALSSSNKRRKTVKFKSASEEADVMKYHDEPIPKKKKRKRQSDKTNSDKADADPSEYGRNY